MKKSNYSLIIMVILGITILVLASVFLLPGERNTFTLTNPVTNASAAGLNYTTNQLAAIRGPDLLLSGIPEQKVFLPLIER